jgi:hypothetical protein
LEPKVRSKKESYEKFIKNEEELKRIIPKIWAMFKVIDSEVLNKNEAKHDF